MQTVLQILHHTHNTMYIYHLKPTAFHSNFTCASTIKSTRPTTPTPQRGPGTDTQNGKSYQILCRQAQYQNELRTVHHHRPTAPAPTYTNATSSSTGPVRVNHRNNVHPTTASAPLVSPIATTTVRNPYKRQYPVNTTVRNPYLKKKWWPVQDSSTWLSCYNTSCVFIGRDNDKTQPTQESPTVSVVSLYWYLCICYQKKVPLFFLSNKVRIFLTVVSQGLHHSCYYNIICDIHGDCCWINDFLNTVLLLLFSLLLFPWSLCNFSICYFAYVLFLYLFCLVILS